MKHLYLYALSIVACAEPTTVSVSGPVYTPSGVAANGGTVTATLAAPCSVGSTYIHRGPVTATVASDGTVSLTLVPTASCATSGNSYAVRYRVTRAGVPLVEYSETWTIPASPSSTTIAAVRSATVPSPLAAVSWTQLTMPSTAASLFLAGPTSGAAAAASFRALAAADLPATVVQTTGGVLAHLYAPGTSSVATVATFTGNSEASYFGAGARIGIGTYANIYSIREILGSTPASSVRIQVANDTTVTDALAIQGNGSIKIYGLAGTGTRSLCVLSSGELAICP